MGKVAVATTDGVNIDGDFNKIQELYIYEVDVNGRYHLVEKSSTMLASEEFSESVITESPADLEAVLAARIDPYAAQELYDKGIVALTVNLPVNIAVSIYGRKSRFLRRDGRIFRVCGTCSDCSSCL